MSSWWKIVLVNLFFFCPQQSKALDLSHHEILYDIGSYRTRYAYAMSNLIYHSPSLKHLPIRLNAQLRAYGTFFLINKTAYDITPIAEYFYPEKIAQGYFSSGLGLDIRIRLLRDVRGHIDNSAEPLWSLAYTTEYKKYSGNISLWTRFYENGISFSLRPQIFYQWQAFALYARYEINYLQLYDYPVHEWTRDSFLGISWQFNLAQILQHLSANSTAK